ncbi:MAG: sulfatase [Verrucomicrobiales bacterium]|nr:sulfatase [Verrucomicrobiales bacterium]
MNLPSFLRSIPARALAFFVLGCIHTLAASASPSRPPNIVFILADDLGIHDLACYGRKDHRTPYLDQLAADGLRFTSAYCAQPICSPSRAAILSGVAPARLHLTTYLPGRRDAPSQRVLHPAIVPQLPLERRTLAECLRDAGYATACIGKWHLGGPEFGPDRQGFDVVYPGRALSLPSADEGSKGEFDLTRRAEAFVEAHRDRPFFLYLAHNAPHIPYLAHPDRLANQTGAFEPSYATVVESLDASVGRLMKRLTELGLRDETLVVFTSDNGGLHVPELQHARVTHNGPFRAGKGYLYEGGLRVPLIVRWPGRIPANRVTDVPVLDTDWLATLLDLCGVPESARPPGDGVGFAKLLTDQRPPPRRPLAWHFPHYTNQGGRPGGAVRDGRWKLVELYDADSVELFDLDSDPGETRNLADAHPRRVRRLRQHLRDWRAGIAAQTNVPNPNVDEMLFRSLYVDFDPSRFRPLEASPADWARIAAWRRGMDAATERPR